jgi:sarcosine oxidase subunit gamma
MLNLQEVTIAAAWNLQGDPGSPEFLDQARRSFGISLPTKPNTTSGGGLLTAMWLGPMSWLLVAGGPLSDTHPMTGFAEKRDTVNATHGALFDVSSSRVAWKIAGPRAEAVLASDCPLDFHPRAFPNGSCAQSLFGHVGSLICRDTGGDFTLLVARSFAREVWLMLCAASARHGYDVVDSTSFGPQ